jgi:hypothetical protein
MNQVEEEQGTISNAQVIQKQKKLEQNEEREVFVSFRQGSSRRLLVP